MLSGGMKESPVKIVQSADKPVPVEVLAESIVAISDGIKKLLAGPIAEDTLVLLIQHAAPTIGSRYNRTNLGTREIRATLRGIEALAKVHLKPKK